MILSSRTLRLQNGDIRIQPWPTGNAEEFHITGIDPNLRVFQGVFSTPARYLALSVSDKQFVFVDIGRSKSVASIEAETFFGLVFTRDGSRLAVTDQNSLGVWSTSEARQIWRSPIPSSHFEFSPDGAFLRASIYRTLALLRTRDGGNIQLNHRHASTFANGRLSGLMMPRMGGDSLLEDFWFALLIYTGVSHGTQRFC